MVWTRSIRRRTAARFLGLLAATALVSSLLPVAVAQGGEPTAARTGASSDAGVPLSWQSSYIGTLTFDYSAYAKVGTQTNSTTYHWVDDVENVVHPNASGSYTEEVFQQTDVSGTDTIVVHGLGSLNAVRPVNGTVTCTFSSPTPSGTPTPIWKRTGGSTLVPELGDKEWIAVDWGVPSLHIPGATPTGLISNEGTGWPTITKTGASSEGPGPVANGTVVVSGAHCAGADPNDFLGYTAGGCAACVFGTGGANYVSLAHLMAPTADFLQAYGDGLEDLATHKDWGQVTTTLGDVLKKPLEKSYLVSMSNSTKGSGPDAGSGESGRLDLTSNGSFSVCTGKHPNVYLYSARGSSEVRTAADPNGLGTPALALYKELKPLAAAGGAQLLADGDPYPAIDITHSFALDRQQQLAPTSHYTASVAEGVTDGVEGLEHIASQQDATGKCWYLVLSGYSQGAEVMRRVLAALPRDILAHVVAVELYGDPYFTAKEPNVTAEGTHSANAEGVRRWGWQMLHLGAAPPALPVPTFSWCNAHDLVCGFNNSLDRLLLGTSKVTAEEAGHFTYQTDACQAAKQVSEAMKGVGVDFGLPPC